MIQIRPGTPADLPALAALYCHARQFMRETGNPHQWIDGYPSPALLSHDIAAGQCFVGTENGQLRFAFSFIVGEDPTYAVIEDGAWLNDAPYGTIHRLASDGTVPGVTAQCLAFCRARMPNLRADTHADNQIMQHLLVTHGFQRCGIIHVANGSARIAYQLPGPDGSKRTTG